jgi:flagellar biosynthesis protein FliR
MSIYITGWMEYLNIVHVFLRLMGFFLLVPAFSHDNIPGRVKILLAMTVSLALYPMLKPILGPLPESIGGLTAIAIRETVIGFLMGFGGYVTFEAINMASQFLSTQMGFGAAGLIDPQNHTQTSALVSLQGWIVLMVFFFMDMHHTFLELFFSSFQVTAKLGAIDLGSRALLIEFTRVTGKLFVLAVQMAAPFTLLILASNLAVGVLSRLLPQMNIILFSFPITILLGLCTLYLLAPDLLSYLENVLGDAAADMASILKTI